MSNREKPHFSKQTLDISERIHQVLSPRRLGSKAVSVFTGSDYPLYRQLDWHSGSDVNWTNVYNTVRVPGDQEAGLFRRNWRSAIVMSAKIEELEEIHEHPLTDEGQEAVAYISEGVVRVGIKPNDSPLFEDLNGEERAVAMRIGKGPLEATMGLWAPVERVFVGVNWLRLVEPKEGISALTTEYPGIALV
jgi:hypothetical protein